VVGGEASCEFGLTGNLGSTPQKKQQEIQVKMLLNVAMG
jgi:hypothetical protein